MRGPLKLYNYMLNIGILSLFFNKNKNIVGHTTVEKKKTSVTAI